MHGIITQHPIKMYGFKNETCGNYAMNGGKER
jgi:hypothetical protein